MAIETRMGPTLGTPTPEDFRRAFGCFPTGVALVTAFDSDTPFGMAMNSLTSVSLDPCLLLVCAKKGSATGQAIRNAGFFAVNLLDQAQGDICRRFVGPDAARFSGLDYMSDMHAVPLIPGAIAYFSCRLYSVYPGGDHDIIVGEVMACQDGDGSPLVYHRGEMAQLAV